MPRRRRIDLPSRGGTVAALEFGPADAPIAMVFSHANGFNALSYRTLLAPVATDVRILAIDLRGHGLTELPTKTEDRRDWLDIRDDLIAVVETLDLSDLVIAGHSIGATTSLLAAAELGGSVKSLVLVEPVTYPPDLIAAGTAGEPQESGFVQGTLRRRSTFDSREAAFESLKGRGAFRSWSDNALRDYLTDGLRKRAEGGFELACSPAWEVSNYVAQAHDTWAALARITCPIQILQASDHSTFRSAPVVDDNIAQGQIKLTQVPDATHFLPMEHPDVVRAALRKALN